MNIALITLGFIIVALAFSIPINHQKRSKEFGYAPLFAFLSLLLGLTFSQFSLWHVELSEFRGRSSVTFSHRVLIMTTIVIWLCGAYFTTQQSQRLLRRAVLFLLSSAVLVTQVETAILIGRWADESGGGGGDIFVDVIGLTSFTMTVFFGYRLIRSFRRKLLTRRAIQEPQN